MPFTEEDTKVVEDIGSIYGHRVILYNDDVNSFEHVEECLMKICFKTEEEAMEIAMEAHTNGKAVCYEGSMEVCETVAERMTYEMLTVTYE